MGVFLLFLAVFCVSWAIPVFVMMPLDTVTNNGQLNNKYPYDAWFKQLKDGGVAGVMCDVWWGLAEPSPRQYSFAAYSQLLQKIQAAGLQFKATMSFHKCGTNVGDECFIPLPDWVRNVGNNNPDIYYTDRERNRNDEYISLGVDNLPLFAGRSPVQIYSDYVGNFVNTFKNYLGNTIVELQISLGPAGELRYPSYPLSRWNFPGVGEFQCYDRYMLAMLNNSAVGAGHPEWSRGGPSNAGSYSCNPCQDNSCGPFFTGGFDNFGSPYGQFFLNWYSSTLIAHGNNILAPISRIVSGMPVRLAAKVSGVHWQFHTPHHGAEQTAGYKNDKGTAYAPIAKMFASNRVSFDFTCFEMKDSEQPGNACSGPQELVAQTMRAMRAAGGHYSGENALPRYDQTAYDTIYDSAKNDPSLFDDFTYLRLGDTLMNGGNWNTFRSFVSRMSGLH